MRDQGEWRADPNDVVAGRLALDSRPVWRDPSWGEWDPGDLFETLLHVIQETATHAGHLDAVRELVDGHQHMVL